MDEAFYAMPGAPMPEDEVRSDPILGELRLPGIRMNSFIRIWEGSVRIGERNVELRLGPEDDLPLDQLIPFARDSIAHVERNESQFHSAIVEELLHTYNERWRDEDDPVLSDDEFRQQLVISSISVTSDQAKRPCAEIAYDCADLFTEHSPRVYLDNRMRITCVTLE